MPPAACCVGSRRPSYGHDVSAAASRYDVRRFFLYYYASAAAAAPGPYGARSGTGRGTGEEAAHASFLLELVWKRIKDDL